MPSTPNHALAVSRNPKSSWPLFYVRNGMYLRSVRVDDSHRVVHAVRARERKDHAVPSDAQSSVVSACVGRQNKGNRSQFFCAQRGVRGLGGRLCVSTQLIYLPFGSLGQTSTNLNPFDIDTGGGGGGVIHILRTTRRRVTRDRQTPHSSTATSHNDGGCKS